MPTALSAPVTQRRCWDAQDALVTYWMDEHMQQDETLRDLVRTLLMALEIRDEYTRRHCQRVAYLCLQLARQMECGIDEQRIVLLGGLLHDIGKIGIDDHILQKPGPLTRQELQQIHMHPEMGCQILSDVKALSPVLPIILCHHEQWDGGGYPGSLRGRTIPRLARICAVADAVDAMTSDRCYQKALPRTQMEQILADGAGRQWDPSVVEAYFCCSRHAVKEPHADRCDLATSHDRLLAPNFSARNGASRHGASRQN